MNSEFADTLKKVGNGIYLYVVGNRYRKALLLVLQEALGERYDYLSWWLYEGDPDCIVMLEDEEQEWVPKEPDALYDNIVKLQSE